MGPPCFPESCRLVQGSKTTDAIITSEQHTQRPVPVGCADLCPIPHRRVPSKGRNKSGTAEVISCLCLFNRDKGTFYIPPTGKCEE